MIDSKVTTIIDNKLCLNVPRLQLLCVLGGRRREGGQNLNAALTKMPPILHSTRLELHHYNVFGICSAPLLFWLCD